MKTKILFFILLLFTTLFSANNPSYSNLGGRGNRSSIITVTISDSLFHAGTGANLVNGDYAQTTNYMWVKPAAGKWILDDFGSGQSKIITEAKWIQGGAWTHGIWKIGGSNDNSSYDTITAGFTLGGGDTTTINMSGNTKGYRYYKWIGMSGTLAASPWIYQTDFKIDSFVVLPPASLSYQYTCIFTDSNTILKDSLLGSYQPYTKVKVYPTLPSGLSMDTITGAITGTPTAITTTTTYYDTVSNSGGSTVYPFSIHIVPHQTLRCTTAVACTASQITIKKPYDIDSLYRGVSVMDSNNTALPFWLYRRPDSLIVNVKFGSNQKHRYYIRYGKHGDTTTTEKDLAASFYMGIDNYRKNTAYVYNYTGYNSLPRIDRGTYADTQGNWALGTQDDSGKVWFEYYSAQHPSEGLPGIANNMLMSTKDFVTFSDSVTLLTSAPGTSVSGFPLFYKQGGNRYILLIFKKNDNPGRLWTKRYNIATKVIDDSVYVGSSAYPATATGLTALFLHNGNLIIPIYGSNASKDFIILFRSVDTGATWTSDTAITSTASISNDLYEPSFAECADTLTHSIYSGNIVCTVRSANFANPMPFRVCRSSDYGHTWTSIATDTSVHIVDLSGGTLSGSPIIYGNRSPNLDTMYWLSGIGGNTLIWSTNEGKTFHYRNTHNTLGVTNISCSYGSPWNLGQGYINLLGANNNSGASLINYATFRMGVKLWGSTRLKPLTSSYSSFFSSGISSPICDTSVIFPTNPVSMQLYAQYGYSNRIGFGLEKSPPYAPFNTAYYKGLNPIDSAYILQIRGLGSSGAYNGFVYNNSRSDTNNLFDTLQTTNDNLKHTYRIDFNSDSVRFYQDGAHVWSRGDSLCHSPLTPVIDMYSPTNAPDSAFTDTLYYLSMEPLMTKAAAYSNLINTFNLTITNSSPAGTISPIAGVHTYDSATGAALSYTPPAGYTNDAFTSTGGVVFNADSSAFTMTEDGTITAHCHAIVGGPTITSQPSSRTIIFFLKPTFRVVAQGTGSLSYQWYRYSGGSWSSISGATSSSYTTPKLTSAYNKNYFRVVVTDSNGSTTSNSAKLTLLWSSSGNDMGIGTGAGIPNQ